RAEPGRAVPGPLAASRASRRLSEGQHIHGWSRRRPPGLALDLDWLRRPRGSLSVPVADGALSEEDAFRAADLVRVGVDAHVRLDVVTGGEDHKATRPFQGVGSEPAGREADEVTWRQDPLPRGFAKHRCAREHVEPLLDPVVVVVWPDRQARLGLIDARADPLSPQP